MKDDESLVRIARTFYEILEKEECTIVEVDKVLNLTKQLVDIQSTVGFEKSN